MYIPDKIKVVIVKGRGVRVFSADEGHEDESQLPVANVRVTWDQLDGMSAVVAYGTSIQAIGVPSPITATIDYPNHRVVFDVAQE